MRLLLDTHTVLWAVDAPARLGHLAAAELRNSENELLVSAATIWELSIKHGLGKLALALPLHEWMLKAVGDLRAGLLPITIDFAVFQATLPRHHGDPFDRMLIAQALSEQIGIVSADETFDQYGVMRIW